MYFRRYQFRIAVYEMVSVSIRAAFVDSRVRQGIFLRIADEVGKLKKVVVFVSLQVGLTQKINLRETGVSLQCLAGICFVRFDVVPELGLTQQLCSCFKGCLKVVLNLF